MKVKRLLKKITALLLCVITAMSVFSTAGCNLGGNSMKGKIKLWSVPSSEKIMLNQQPLNSVDSTMKITMAKNESEAVQLIITPEKNVVFDVEVTDLVCGENKISANNIEVYGEHYVYLDHSRNSDLILGYYPDALVPFDLFKNAGENKIRANNNQGLYINVTTDENTVAGTYTGKVNVIVNEETISADLIVTVADFVLPTSTNSRTAFAIWDEGIFFSSYYNDTVDYYKMYYDKLLDYRLNGIFIPGTQDKFDTSITISQWVDCIEKYALDERVTSYCLPYTRNTVYDEEHDVTHNFFYTDRMEELLIELVNRSTNDKNLLEKAYLYLDFCDEPPLDEAWRIKKTDYAFYKIKEKVYNNLELYPADGSKDEVRESVMGAKHVVTVSNHDAYYPLDGEGNYVGGAEAFCPLFNETSSYTDFVNFEYRKSQGLDTWYYGCITPWNPYPSYHIDATGVSSRIIPWMEKYYGFEGELYWQTTANTRHNYDIWKSFTIDVYKDPYTHSTTPGEGLLLYPGTRYGVDYPLPSMRIEQIKDGREEWEILNMIEQKLSEASSVYARDFKLKDYVQKLTERLYHSLIVDADPYTFADVREELYALLQMMNGEERIVIEQDSDASGKVDITVYATKDINLKVDGQKAQVRVENGNYVYTATVYLISGNNFANISYTKGEKEYLYKKYIGSISQRINDFNTQDKIDKVGKTDGAKSFQGIAGEPVNDTAVSLNTDSKYAKNGNSLKFDFRGVSTNTTYKPGIYLVDNKTGYENYENLGKVKFSVYSTNEERSRIYLAISTKNKNGSGNTSLVITDTIDIVKGWNEVELTATGKSSLDLANLKQVAILTDNPIVETEDGYIENKGTLYFDELIFIDKVEQVFKEYEYVDISIPNDNFNGLYDEIYKPDERKATNGVLFDFDDIDNNIPYYFTFVKVENLNAKLEINNDSKYITQGTGSLKFTCTTKNSSNMLEIMLRIPDAYTNFVDGVSTISFDVFNARPFDIKTTLSTNRMVPGYYNLLEVKNFKAKEKTSVSLNIREMLKPSEGEVDYREDVSIFVMSLSLPMNSEIELYFDNFIIK